MEDFIHLHVHTQYSLLDGMSSIPKLVDKAVDNGMRGMAITDHGNMFGVKDLFDYCNGVNKNRKKEGLEPFKPIFGCEVYVARRRKEDMDNNMGDRGGHHLILLAKNFHGYQNLIKLVSRAWVDGFYGRPRTDHADLALFHEDIICCSACIAGEVPVKVLKGDLQGARESAAWFKNLFGDDYYLELQRHEVKNPMQRANRETFPLQQVANAELIKIARELDIKLVCTNDSHFVDEENAEAHDHLLCLSTGKDLDDPTRMLYSKQEWFKTKEEMNEVFQDVPEALANTIEILDKVETYNIESDPIMPFFPIPEAFGTEEQWRKNFSEEDLYREFTTDENGENALPQEDGEKKIAKLGGYDKLYRIKFEADYLGKLGYEGASRLYGTGYEAIPDGKALQPKELSAWAEAHGISKEVDDRIRFELHIMKTMGFPGYFLIVQDFINSARQELGVWVGPGRGSAAGSVVAYCLGITKLDPMKYDLLFERFLNPDRISLPDIDTDFDDDGRGKVLNWVMDKYGHENCAHIITYGTMAAKNSLKDVGRVEKVPLNVVNAWCKAMPDRLPDGMKSKLENYIKCVPELQAAQASTDSKESNTIKYARMLEGTIRGTGIHACGFIICRDPISDHVPVSTADDPDFPGKKTAVTQYDGHVIESTGLIKMDFLGLKTLSEMKEACRVIKEAHGIDIDLDRLPIDDELTYKLYQEGRTIGTFQFESAGMQKYLKELHPTVFEDLIAMNALYRPGPMDYIPSFIARKNGREEIKYDIPIMEKYLKDTYGITVYQEQVMLLSRLLADFTRGESDALRKAMGKKKKDIVDKMKPKFIEGGKKNGHDPKILEKIWGDWEKFASYAFNKSHAVCYAWVAYQTAWLKAHYPAEYMSAVLARSLNNVTELAKQMDECRAMGLSVKGPDINLSRQRYSVDAEGAVRFGLAGIKGFGEGAADAVVNERKKNGPYKDIFDLVERVDMGSVNRKALESLALSGALDSLGKYSREQYMAVNSQCISFLDQVVKYGQKFKADKESNEMSLFGDMEDCEIQIQHPEPPKEVETWSTLERLNKEKELVGLFLSAHPLDEYKFQLLYACNTTMAELESVPNPRGKDEQETILRDLETKPDELERISKLQSREITCGGIVTGWREGTSKAGNPYGILTLEDYSGKHDFVLFGAAYPQWRGFGKEGMYLFIQAKYQPKRFVREVRSIFDVEFSIGTIKQLNQVSDNLLTDLTVMLNCHQLSKAGIHQMADAIIRRVLEDESHRQTEAKTSLYFELCDPIKNYVVKLYSRTCRVHITTGLIEFLRSLDGVMCRINNRLVEDQNTQAEEEEAVIDESELLSED